MATLLDPDPLSDFAAESFEFEDIARRVYVSGSGPAIIVMAEMPGISPHVARFARWIREAGFTIFMPSLFGKDGVIPSAAEGAEVFRRACISAEFRAFGGGESSPVTNWLRALARRVHKRCGGPGVGAVGMCFTGNFALSMMLEPAMLTPVLCQPALPMDVSEAIESSPDELREIRSRLEQDDLSVLAYRFEGDHFCRAERFETYSRALGERFIGKVIPDSAANSEVTPFVREYVPTPHSVVTVHLIDEAGQPTQEARDEILDFISGRLLAD